MSGLLPQQNGRDQVPLTESIVRALTKGALPMQIFDGARTWFGNGFATTVFLPISERTMALRVTSSAEVQAERRTPEPIGRESHARLPHRGPK